jgi:hypothetical protein
MRFVIAHGLRQEAKAEQETHAHNRRQGNNVQAAFLAQHSGKERSCLPGKGTQRSCQGPKILLAALAQSAQHYRH